MAKGRLFDLPETKGSFQLRGLVTGTEKEKFYEDKKTSTGKDFRKVNFGVEVDEGKTLYAAMQGMPQKEAFFYSSKEKKTERVPWANRHTFNKEGYRMIGVNLGTEKTVDKDGKTVNKKVTLADFDACKHVSETLKDGQSIFMKGNLEYGSFTDDKGTKRNSVKMVPNQISLCADVDFGKDDFEAMQHFTQVIVFMSIDQEKDDNGKPTGRFVVLAKIVNYSSIEDAEFIITNSKLANTFKKALKPYCALEVHGIMDATQQVEEVKQDDGWGDENQMTKVNAPTKREFIITGANPDSVDSDTYSEELIEAAMVKIRNAKNAESDYGSETESESGWGSNFESANEEDEEW